MASRLPTASIVGCTAGHSIPSPSGLFRQRRRPASWMPPDPVRGTDQEKALTCPSALSPSLSILWRPRQVAYEVMIEDQGPVYSLSTLQPRTMATSILHRHRWQWAEHPGLGARPTQSIMSWRCNCLDGKQVHRWNYLLSDCSLSANTS